MPLPLHPSLQDGQEPGLPLQGEGDLWDQHEVSAITTKAKKIRNPHVGMLRFEAVSTWLNPRPGVRMLVYTPSDAETLRRMEKLVAMFEADVA